MTIKHLKYAVFTLLASLLLQSCINEDMQECPNEYNLRIVFDRNMLYADAFASCVKSVDIQVFDHTTGMPVYRHTDSGDALASGNYLVTLPIPAGTYDVLCWCGLNEGNSFSYTNAGSQALTDQGMLLNTDNGVSNGRLNDLYHGMLIETTFIDNNDIGSFEPQTKTIYLTKNTNRVNVVLLNLDGSEMGKDAFTWTITSANGEMAYDNKLITGSHVTYSPWSITPILQQTITEPEADETKESTSDNTVTTKAGLSAEFSMARLTPESNSRLDVVRVSDGERIISVPLEANLLLYKGEFHSDMSDAEYLDRQDDYTITFILDKNNNWDRAAMIYIQDWATLPVQYQDF